MSTSPIPRRSSKTQGSPESAPKLSPVAAVPATSAPPAEPPSSQSPRNSTSLASSAAHTIPHQQVPPQSEPDQDNRKRKAMESPPATSSAPAEVEMKEAGASAPMPAAQSSAPVPEETPERPPKKTRTNTPWTPAEEKRLKAMRDENKTWSEIAKMFPNRTEGSVKKHWYKDMHYADFAEDESQALLQAIKEYDANKWKVIGQKVGKPAKACEQYAKENFAGRM